MTESSDDQELRELVDFLSDKGDNVAPPLLSFKTVCCSCMSMAIKLGCVIKAKHSLEGSLQTHVLTLLHMCLRAHQMVD